MTSIATDTGRPTVHLLHGFIGSGKTTYARQLEKDLDARRFTHDEWMVRAHGFKPREEHFAARYTEIFEAIWDAAALSLGDGRDVILDYGFWTRISRDEARERTRDLGAIPAFYSLQCPLDVMRKRALKRSETPCTDSLWIDAPGFDKLLQQFEPMQKDKSFVVVKGLAQR